MADERMIEYPPTHTSMPHTFRLRLRLRLCFWFYLWFWLWLRFYLWFWLWLWFWLRGRLRGHLYLLNYLLFYFYTTCSESPGERKDGERVNGGSREEGDKR